MREARVPLMSVARCHGHMTGTRVPWGWRWQRRAGSGTILKRDRVTGWHSCPLPTRVARGLTTSHFSRLRIPGAPSPRRRFRSPTRSKQCPRHETLRFKARAKVRYPQATNDRARNRRAPEAQCPRPGCQQPLRSHPAVKMPRDWTDSEGT